jgi:hypothetical protein
MKFVSYFSDLSAILYKFWKFLSILNLLGKRKTYNRATGPTLAHDS